LLVKADFDFRGETAIEFSDAILGEHISTLPKLSIHGHLRSITGDRLAVASALLLGNRITEYLDVGRPVSKRVATEIRRFLQDDTVDVRNATTSSSAIHNGSVELVLSEAGQMAERSPGDSRSRIAFTEQRSYQGTGRLFNFSQLIVTTNSWLFNGTHSTSGRRRELECALAVPVLFSQDLSISRISVPLRMTTDRDHETIHRISRLLASTDLRLEVKEEERHD
jgi:hypothetical protein